MTRSPFIALLTIVLVMAGDRLHWLFYVPAGITLLWFYIQFRFEIDADLVVMREEWNARQPKWMNSVRK